MKFKIPRNIKVGIDLTVEANGKELTKGQSSKERQELSKIFSREEFNL